ncbi:MAG: hypothetical protein ACKVXR_04930 [Planctomycetota bacterium]
MRISTLQQARPRIMAEFDRRGNQVYSREDLERILAERRDRWRLAVRITTSAFCAFLTTHGELRHIRLEGNNKEEPVDRWSWGETSPLAIASSLGGEGAYHSHASAMYVHGVTKRKPAAFYINREQSVKPRGKAGLSQDRIDMAFSRPQRMSNNVLSWAGFRFVFLSGKHTDNYAVEAFEGPQGEPVQCTGLERTLVDIAVRPSYAGGLEEVQAAYRSALERVSINKLVTALRKIGHVYPYHQAIGFYLERAGCAATPLAPLRRMGIKLNFYLAYDMEEKVLDPTWRVYHPPGF